MSEEDKKAIEYWKRDIALYHWNTQLASEHYAQIILNLIEKQQKELNSLKEIEQRHREVNGKLRVELEQEKEINKEIAIKNHKIKEESNAYREEIIRLDNELEQEKEKNKELYEIKYIASTFIERPMSQFSVGEFRYKVNNSISKDKIKEIRDKAELMDYYTLNNVIDDLSILIGDYKDE